MFLQIVCNRCTTPCLEKTSHLWLAITLTHMNRFWYFFGRNFTNKVGYQKCFDMPPQITCASALSGKMGKHENHIFHSNAVLVESTAAVRLCCMHNALSFEKKLSSVVCLIASTFVEIVRYPTNTVHSLSLSLDEQLPSVRQQPTPWQTWLTQSMWVTDSRILGAVWCIQSIVLTVKGGSAVTRWYFNVFRVFLVKSIQHLSEKTQFSGFLFPQVVRRNTS